MTELYFLSRAHLVPEPGIGDPPGGQVEKELEHALAPVTQK